MRIGCSLASTGLLLLAACAPSPRVGPVDTSPVTAAGTLSAITETIFVPRCATSACHVAGNTTAPGSYEPGRVYVEVVSGADGESIPSTQAPGLNVVEPFHPEQSYLVMKLRGTAGAAGGTATTMPLSEAPLEESDIEAIEAWILNGAPND